MRTSSKRTKAARAARYTAAARFDTLADVITLAEIAVFYRISESSLRGKLARGEFHPLPIAEFPFRWRKQDVAADLRQRAAAARKDAAARRRATAARARRAGRRTAAGEASA